FFFQAEDGIRDFHVTGVQTCALPILGLRLFWWMLEYAAMPSWAVSNLQVPLWWLPLLFLIALLALLPRGAPARWLVLVLIVLWGFPPGDRKSTRLNSSHVKSSYAVFCLKKKTR